MDLYTKRGVFYAPTWKNPRTGRVVPAHTLGTRDRAEAESLWTLERARDLAHFPAASASGAQQDLPGVDGLRLSDVFARYLVHKRAGIAVATYKAYEQYADLILRRLDDWKIEALAPPSGTEIIGRWARDEIVRLERTHTVKKWLEAIIKPALKYAHAQRWLEVLPTFPDVDSDYDERGRRELVLSVDEFVAMRRALAEVDDYQFDDGAASIAVYPRLWFDLAVSTGLHDSDLNRFAGRMWRRLGKQWWRENAKGKKHYPPTWLPCDPYMQECLERAADRRDVVGDALWIATAPPPKQWMRRRLIWAAKRAGVPEAPQPIDLRHTCAVWKRDAGWEFDETAKWLGNSSGIVERVYAQLPTRRMTELVERTSHAGRALLAAVDAPPRLRLAKPQGEK